MKNIKYLCLLLGPLAGLFSCQGYLDEKPEKSILVPSTVEDVRALLDYYTTINENALIDFIQADDWVTDDPNWQRLAPWEQNAYLWQEQVFEPVERSTDYSRLYRKILTVNVSLDVLQDLESSDEVRHLKGEALFVRALAYFQLAQLFLPSPVLDDGEIKIPVKLTPDMNQSPQWWTVSEVLVQVEQDLLDSYGLISPGSLSQNRPNKKVAQAVLARLYLYTGRWEEALESAEYVLDQNTGSLLDYHEQDSLAPYPFALFNSEVLYYGITSSFSVTASAATYVNMDLTEKYGKGDLRSALFFTKGTNGNLFKGSYNGDYNLFTGIALPEMYLTGAEALVRLGRTQEGLSLLGVLAGNRYQRPEDWEENLSKNPLDLVLEERQKEQVFRGTRWMDIKRLSAMGELGESPIREIGGKAYHMPNPNRLYLELPNIELDLEFQ
ncbi:RagB/SusD family nutrient uptake outer membrane protein [Algoriphagus sp. H41]|uniref:RagB/SusD family nutrient uptake outer membrane protein n=1 Tax=Algoriphagus oliviformis TaxID=2811231 RepID=A0ABS3CA63_9BACT|nr:RagB/SusD family nutrient uptake outer membrane protein [Algoriphagus oliviformis]MBN7813434.1 RagB/SusD family nutrient uptake outer membrane protein [Algoriphagus oliviformis]